MPPMVAGHLRSIYGAALAATAALACSAIAHGESFQDAVAADARGDQPAALQGYRDAAAKGEAPAQYALGQIYLTGRGVACDYGQAFQWFQKAALHGNPGAEFEMGVMLTTGVGTQRDRVRGEQWLRKSASAGFEPAELKLAVLHERGEHVSKDFGQALLWATKAAEQGDVDAQLEAGRLYAEAARTAPTGRGGLSSGQFHAVMDEVFGPAKWRETSGYRTPAQENELRAEGAGTVPPGTLSRHSIGSPKSPGAYDVVVLQLSTSQAATKLMGSGVKFRRIIVEGAHGPEGPHLHIEPLPVHGSEPRAGAATRQLVDLGGEGGASEQTTDYELARHWLSVAAERGNVEARVTLERMRVGRAPASGVQISPTSLPGGAPQLR